LHKKYVRRVNMRNRDIRGVNVFKFLTTRFPGSLEIGINPLAQSASELWP